MSDDDNPYQAPASDLAPARPAAAGGSIEQTLAGGSQLEIGEVMSEAWRRTKGIKTIVVGGMLLLYAGVFVVTMLAVAVTGADEGSVLVTLFVQALVLLLMYPFLAGVMMLGLRQSVGAPVEFRQLFDYYGMTGPIFAVAALQALATNVGVILLILPGLYLAVALSLAVPLKVEKNLGVLDCLTTSLKLVNKQFLNVAVLLIIIGLAIALSALTIVGPIWTVPWGVMVFAIVYRQLAGVELA